MRAVTTAAEARAIDRAAIEERGIPGAVLMEHAGRAVADAVGRELLAGARGPVVVVAGTGNNGGDGHVAARWLRAAGVPVTVVLIGRRDAVSGDAAIHLTAATRCGAAPLELADFAALRVHGGVLAGAGLVVDALFGTGLARPVEGLAASVVERVNAAPARVVAVDLPSGLDADLGVPLGAVARADRTIALGTLKPAHVGAPGFARCGVVELAEIGLPAELIRAGSRLAVVEAADVRGWSPQRTAMDHKGRSGHVLAVAGSPGKRGAGRLAALAALRGGAGLVTLAGPGHELAAPDPVMTATLDDAGGLAALADGKAALLLGPGMATGPAGRALLDAVLDLELPRLLDADALNLLDGDLTRFGAAPGAIVLTPHPGEAARLLRVDVATIEGDRIGAARRLAEATGAVVVLKGARTVVVEGGGDGFTTINPTGGPALATAGTGDVLAGLIAALLAQGLAAAAAARLAVWVHGAAGDLAAVEVGVPGVVATDVLERLPAAFRDLAAG